MTTKQRKNVVEYIDSLESDELQITVDDVIRFGNSEYLPIAPAIAMVEAFGNAVIRGMHIGRDDIKVTRRVIEGGQLANCYYEAASTYTDKATGDAVATGTIQTSWFELPTSELQRNIIHDNIHTIGAINTLYGDKVDVSGRGNHRKGTFAANATMFFTPESLYTPEEVKNDDSLGQNDTWMLKPVWEFNVATQRKIDDFDWDDSVFNVEIVEFDKPEPPKRIPTEIVGCKVHHWDIEELDVNDAQYRYTRRTIDPMPNCPHKGHDKRKRAMVTKPAAK